MLVAAYFGHPTVAQACSCVPLTSIAEMSDGIFIGTFTSADGTNSNFKVEETLKGEVADVIYVSASMVGSSCYEPFYRGRRYLILADRTQSGWITNPHCGAIYRIKQDVLKMLRQHLEGTEKD